MALSKRDRLAKTFRSMIIQEAETLEEARELARGIAYDLKVGVRTNWPPKGHLGNSDTAILPGKTVSFYKQQRSIVANACVRAKNFGQPATLTLDQWLAVLNHFDRKCAYCQAKPYEVLEHFIPLSVNSLGSTAVENCVPSCRGCNVKKGRSGLSLSAMENVYSYLQTTNELYTHVKTDS